MTYKYYLYCKDCKQGPKKTYFVKYESGEMDKNVCMDCIKKRENDI